MTHVDKSFGSILEMPPFIEDNPDLYGRTKRYEGSAIPPSKDWDGNLGMEGALEMARNGGRWDEGAALMREAVAGAVDLKSRARLDTIENDVAGFMPDIDAFIAGQPDSMLSMEEGDEFENPVITMGVHIGRSANVTQQEAINRGAAILSLIDDIEHKGFRVELWAIWRNEWLGDSADIRIKLKDAAEGWSPHSVAFALCHGGMNRRLIFATVEGIPGLSQLADGFGMSMNGHPEDMDIWFPRVNFRDRSKWGTIGRAVRSATSTFNNQLKENESD